MYVTHLESTLDSTRFEAGKIHTVHQGRPLWVRYDLARVRAAVEPAQFVPRPPDLLSRQQSGSQQPEAPALKKTCVPILPLATLPPSLDSHGRIST
jgi:hypothetical protein